MNLSASYLLPGGNSGATGTMDTPIRNIGVMWRGRQEIAALFLFAFKFYFIKFLGKIYIHHFFLLQIRID